MFDAFERMVAMRYLRARRQEGFISVIAGFSLLGIGLGVATLIIVMSVMNGFRGELLGRILGLNGHVGVYSISSPMTDYDQVAVRIGEIPGVFSAVPQVEGQVMALANGISSGGLVRGLRRSDLAAKEMIADNIKSGSLERFSGNDAVVIGSRMARRLGLSVGGKLTLISPTSTSTVVGSVPRMKAYTVTAIFEVGMFEYDNSFIYLPLKAAQIFFRSGEAVNAIEIFLNHADQVDKIRPALLEVIGEGRRALDWKQRNSSFFSALQVERNVMFLILTLIILVAAFNIISSMIMLVKDKASAIAVLRTMGATRGSVMRIFFLAGASVGVVGTVFGTVLGLLFCANIETIRNWVETLASTKLFPAEVYFLSKLPAEVDTMEVLSVILMALFLSFAATIYPAWRAARLDPVEALRYE